MIRLVGGILVLLFGLVGAAHAHGQEKAPKPTEQLEALEKEFNDAANAYYLRAKTGEERSAAQARLEKILPRSLDLAEKNLRDPIALDALVLTINGEMWLVNNCQHPGFGKNSPEVKAYGFLLRDHVKSDKIGEAIRRAQYGFRKECETFLRTAATVNPHRDMRALASLRLAQFLNGRRQKLDVIKERPEMAQRYAGIYGSSYLDTLQRQSRAKEVREVEAILERAANEYGDVKVPYGDTVAQMAQSDLHEIRHLSVGKLAPDIEGEDQDGKRFKLSDYRGKAVLLYFWSEY